MKGLRANSLPWIQQIALPLEKSIGNCIKMDKLIIGKDVYTEKKLAPSKNSNRFQYVKYNKPNYKIKYIASYILMHRNKIK